VNRCLARAVFIINCQKQPFKTVVVDSLFQPQNAHKCVFLFGSTWTCGDLSGKVGRCGKEKGLAWKGRREGEAGGEDGGDGDILGSLVVSDNGCR